MATARLDALKWLTAGVAGVGASSFFSDSGHEITTAMLPSFLAGTLHAGALGLIESASDAPIGVAKLAGGPLADDPAWRARLARGGYLSTALLGGAIGITTAVAGRAITRWILVRPRIPLSGPRRAAGHARPPATGYGRAYGLERAGDNLGALAGPLLAALLVTLIGIHPTLLVAAIPGVLAAATSVAILIYAGHNAIAALASLAGGALIDRLGSRTVFAAGAGVREPLRRRKQRVRARW